MNQIILAVDDNGKFLEYIPKMKGHTGEGRRHLAIVVLLFNSKGEVLLQKRKHKIFDNVWDMTAATHPLHRIDGSDETLEEAAWRCLEVEFGIKEKMPLQNKGFFNYFAPYRTVRGDFCENEHCAMMVGEYNGELKLHPASGYGYKWTGKEDFLKDISQNPEDYTPWAIEGLKKFLKQLLPNSSNIFNVILDT